MELTSSYKHGYLVLVVEESINATLDIEELLAFVERNLEEGITNIALSLTNESHLVSRTISVVVECFGSVKRRGGDFVLICPQGPLHEVLTRRLRLDKLITFYESEEELPAPK